MGEFLLNVLLAFLALFAVRYVGTKIMPEGEDKDKILWIIALIVAVVVFLLNFAEQILEKS